MMKKTLSVLMLSALPVLALAGGDHQGGHGMADFLHLARPEVLQHLRSVVLAQGDEQRGALLEAFFRASCHLHPSNP